MKSKGSGKVKRRFKKIVHFDEEKRTEYLTGFRKRKNERREKAKEQAAEELKEERKRIKDQHRESMRSHWGLTTQVEEAALRLVNSSFKETPTHSIAVEELDFGGSNLFLGSNDKESDEQKENKTTDTNQPETRPGAAVFNLKKALQPRPSSRKTHFDRKFQAAKLRAGPTSHNKRLPRQRSTKKKSAGGKKSSNKKKKKR